MLHLVFGGWGSFATKVANNSAFNSGTTGPGDEKVDFYTSRQVPTANEFRTRNRLMRMYKRIA